MGAGYPLTILVLRSGDIAPTAQVQQAPTKRPPPGDRMAQFASTVLADTDGVWTTKSPTGAVSRCHTHCPWPGPKRHGPSDVVQAYQAWVIVPEVGHHVQNQLGISTKVQQARQPREHQRSQCPERTPRIAGHYSAGISAHQANKARQLLESG